MFYSIFLVIKWSDHVISSLLQKIISYRSNATIAKSVCISDSLSITFYLLNKVKNKELQTLLVYFCSVDNILWSCANIQIFSTIIKSSLWHSNWRINVNKALITSRHLWMTKHTSWFKPDHEVQHGIIASEKRGLLRSTSAGSSLRSNACMVQWLGGNKNEMSLVTFPPVFFF